MSYKESDKSSDAALSCRLPSHVKSSVRLGHGSGGRLMSDLIEKVFLNRLWDSRLGPPDDATVVTMGNGPSIAVTTDSYVVQPIFFPGGDIGSLAIHGTINDLAVRGAIPRYITAAFILEEGLLIADLQRIVDSMSEACRLSDVTFIAGDTKVVNKGAGDQIFITTTGIGQVFADPVPASNKARPGDVILVSGELGLHGTAIMCAREGLELETDITSDSAPLHTLVASMFLASKQIHCLRDVTRGGLASVLNEIAHDSQVGMEIREKDIPVNGQVKSVCELLGLDPYYVACEGRLVAVVDELSADSVLQAMRAHPEGVNAAAVGRVVAEHSGRVVCVSQIGGKRIVDKLSGEQLPRIC